MAGEVWKECKTLSFWIDYGRNNLFLMINGWVESLSQADSILLRPCDQMAEEAETTVATSVFFSLKMTHAPTQGETEESMRDTKLKLQELLELCVCC